MAINQENSVKCGAKNNDFCELSTQQNLYSISAGSRAMEIATIKTVVSFTKQKSVKTIFELFSSK